MPSRSGRPKCRLSLSNWRPTLVGHGKISTRRKEKENSSAPLELSRYQVHTGVLTTHISPLIRTLLVDAIREPQVLYFLILDMVADHRCISLLQVTWERILPQLQKDPRFTNSPLPVNQQVHLFHAHIGHLRSRHLNSLHSLFESHAPSLATPFRSLPLESLMSSLPVTKLGLNENTLEDEFARWQRERSFEARKAFDEMLAENSFVEFWGRLGKIGGEGVEGGVKVDEDGMAEDEGAGGGGKVDMKALAKNVDVQEIERVLKVRLPFKVVLNLSELSTI